MVGIIGNALNQNDQVTKPFDTGTTLDNGNTQSNIYAANTKDVTPTLRTVDAANDTVAGQLHSLLADDSPVIQQARSQAMDTANSRGLLNSSMAAGAGQAAATAAATPIAAADASTYSASATHNQDVTNQASQFNAGATNTANLNATQAANQSGLSGQQSQQDLAMQNLKGTQATSLANIEANYKDLMQTSASAAQQFAVSSQNIAAILADPNTSAEQKQSAVDKQTQLLQSQLTIVGSIANLDLGGLLDFGV